MAYCISRRRFITKAGLAACALPFVSCLRPGGGAVPEPVPGLKLGYTAITWSGNDAQAIAEISGLGYKGVQLRSNTLEKYGNKPEELRQLLTQNQLALAMFSGGDVNINTKNEETMLASFVAKAKFIKAIGGSDIQLTNASRPKNGLPTPDDLVKYGRLLNEVGRRTRDLGVQASYHNHMHQLGETPQEVSAILYSCDPNNVKLLLDIGHYQQGGGDPVQAIKEHKNRLHALHLKDVRPKAGTDPKAYVFVELGQGKVDLASVFSALADIKFKGWGIVELDGVPDKTKSPQQCAQISKAYLNANGFKF